MRILFITSTLEPKAGWGTHSRNIVESAVAHGHEALALVSERSAEPLCEERAIVGRPLHVLSSRLLAVLTAWRIASVVRTWKPDLVHVLVEPLAICIPLASKLCTMPRWMMTLYGTYSVTPFLNPSTKARMCQAWLQCSHFLICSTFTRERTLAAARLTSPELAKHIEIAGEVFRLGIQPGTYIPEHQRKDGVANVLFVGALKPRKGILEILKGCSAFHKRSEQKFHVHLVGEYAEDAPYIQELFAFVQSSGMEPMVTFHGHASEEALDALYKEGDLFMMLSKDDHKNFEGFGLVFLEANSYGIPTIGSLHSGCTEAIDEGKSGYVVEPWDAEAVAQRMQWILEEGRIARADCRAWADSHNLAQQAETVEACYARIG